MPPPFEDEELATLSEQPSESLVGGSQPQLPALALAWLSGEQSRIGEVCLLPVSDGWGPPRVFGRGESRADDPERRAQLVRQLPGGVREATPISNPHISRVQLLLRAHTDGRIAIENLGRSQTYRNGERFESAELRPGDVLRIGQQALLLCVVRPAWARAGHVGQNHAFGQADRHGLVGESPAVWELRRNIHVAAAEDSHVLLLGETGTGKELAARAIHADSPRRQLRLVARNAATLPEGLVDAELFGSARNYPNAGMPDRPGLIGEAHGSTLFLDEFGELSHALQVHLLRVLDEGEYQRLGESMRRQSSFRMIAATNRPIDCLREDVIARFKMRIGLPSLAERREDIPLLIRRAAESSSERRSATGAAGTTDFPIGLVEKLLRHPFTGNIRELQALVFRFSYEPTYQQWDVWQEPGRPSTGPARAPSREEIERCLQQNGWNQEKTWRSLGLSSRYALRRLLRKLGIEQPPSSPGN